MKRMNSSLDAERFQSGADKYAAYLETPEGRLRLDLAFANLQELLPQDRRSFRALEARLTEEIVVKQGDAAQLSHLFEVGSFDVILCHNTREYVDDPCAVLRSAA